MASQMMNDEFRVSRQRNAKITTAGIITIFAVYFYSVSRASQSDNIGVLLIPLLVPVFHGSIISLLIAFAEAFINGSGTWRIMFKRMPILFRLTGIFSLAISIYITFAYSISGVFQLLLFPFWAVEYIF